MVQVEREIADCLNATFAYGWLTKGPGLCHGLSYSAYAFLCALGAVPESNKGVRDELTMATLFFANLAMQWKHETSKGAYRLPDHPDSLMEGSAGAVVLLCDIMMGFNQGHAIGFPLFSDL